MKRSVAILACYLVAASTGFAQAGSNEGICGNGKAETKARIAACSALIADAAFARRAWAYDQRGDARYDAGDRKAALADFDASLGIDPDYVPAVRNRAQSNFEFRKCEAALADARHLVALRPDDYWAHYLNGLVLSKLGQKRPALEAYTRSISLKGDYYPTRVNRALLFETMNQDALARHDLRRAEKIEPLGRNAYFALARLLEKSGDKPGAIRNYRMGSLLDPDWKTGPARIARLVDRPEAPELAPLEFVPPQKGLTLEYLRVRLPRDKRSEMEKSISAIADLVIPKRHAVPKSAALISRKVTGVQGSMVTIASRLEAQRSILVRPPATHVSDHGFLITEVGHGNTRMNVVYDTGDPGAIWPLETGKTVSGKAHLELPCPKVPNPATAMLGCTPGKVAVTVGHLDYRLEVLEPEQIVVPLGVFRTYKVRYRQKGALEILGNKDPTQLETKWWIAPSLHMWVRRWTQEEDDVMVLEATRRTQGS